MYNEKYRQVHWLKIKYCSEKHMKKFKINVQGYGCILLCLILCIMILLPIPVSAQEDRSKVVRVGWYEGTYNTTGPDGQRRGYSYEYQQAVAAHTGWKYEYVEGSWAELMNMLKNGQIDLLGGISYAEERSTSMLFSELPWEKINITCMWILLIQISPLQI